MLKETPREIPAEGCGCVRMGIVTVRLSPSVLATGLLLMTGCGGSSADPEATPTDSTSTVVQPLSDRAAARQFAAVVNRYRRSEAALVGRGYALAHEDRGRCPDLVSPTGLGKRAAIRHALVVESLTQLKMGHTVAPGYPALAKRLSAIPTTNPVLRTIASRSRTMASEVAAKLKDANFDLCAHLDDWRRMNWSKTYAKTLRNAPFTIYGVDRNLYVRIVRGAGRLVSPLQKLGLPLQDTLRVANSTITPL